MQNILVTGGAGYIGSHTCKHLSQSRYVPICLDNLMRGHRWAVKWGPLFLADLKDTELIRKAIRENNISAVIHLAAFAYVGESTENPMTYFENNVICTINLLKVMLEEGIDKIVFSSSCAVYGLADEHAICESHPKNPINPYGESKLFVEKILHWCHKSYGLKYVTLRYFNAAGADPEGGIGEDHQPEPHLIPLIIDASLGRRKTVHIFGNDYPTKDGTAERDYVHVTDLADAHVKALKYLFSGGTNLELNLGTNKSFSVREVIKMVEKVGGRKVPFRQSKRRVGDPPMLLADSSLAYDIIGWIPEHSDLEEIIQTAWHWHTS